MPPWDAIVEIMNGKQLGFADEVLNVVYSKDRTVRYVVLKDARGLLCYLFESICPFDEEEWKYTYVDGTTLPAMWMPLGGTGGHSLFETEEELLREIIAEPEYKLYFC